MTACTDFRSVFDLWTNEAVLDLKEVNPVLKEAVNTAPSPQRSKDKSPEDDRREVSDKMVCSACRCSFINREEQREHYKIDWHRFNLRQKMAGVPPLTAEEFEKRTGAGDLSSISGSESDSDDEDQESDGQMARNVTCTEDESSAQPSLATGRLSNRVVLQSALGEYLLVYRCILMGKSDEEQDAVSSLKTINPKTVWVILMTGGGHFAGAVFEGKQTLQHKTFHRYTVRAKRGTAQGLRDSQNCSHAPKSAGAALRRYNEAALLKDIQDLLTTWAEHLRKASAIFIRSPSYNKTIFFGGRGAPLEKKDPRIRSLPFVTRRATFREVQRVHEVLSTVQVYGKDTDMSAVFSPSKKQWKNTIRPAEQKVTDQETAPGGGNEESSEEEELEIQLETVELTMGTLHLCEFEMHPSSRRKRRRRKKDEPKKCNKGTGIADDQEELQAAKPEETTHCVAKKSFDESREYSLRDSLYTACKVGDEEVLLRLLQLPPENAENTENLGSDPLTIPSPLSLLNKPVDSSGFTLLHVATAAAQKAVVRLLLDAGADPACRDNRGQTPYIVAPDKDTRNVFRKYMGENPQKYDYAKAQVPGPLTAESESKKAEKKKAQRAQRKQREKEQKEEKKQQELEAEEQRRFASLTDREKRALAAERRFAEQAAKTGIIISNVQRCWLCGKSLQGKIPFNYLDFSFCSPQCVQAHRKASAPAAKT